MSLTENDSDSNIGYIPWSCIDTYTEVVQVSLTVMCTCFLFTRLTSLQTHCMNNYVSNRRTC